MVARVLYNTALHLLQHGDVIQDGSTVTGIEEDERWECQRDESMAGPEREVVDLLPEE